jgi:hypothetical protein
MNRKENIIEIFSANDPHLQTHASLTGPISTHNDRFCQSLILSLNKSCKVQIPKSSRQHLNIQSGFISFQVFLTSKSFAIEIVFFDTSNTKRKIILNSCRNSIKDTIQSKISINSLPKECWLNLCIDLGTLSNWSFCHSFNELDTISVIGPCKIRKIFATSKPLSEDLPNGYELPSFSKTICVNSNYVEDTFSLLDRKKVADENFRLAEERVKVKENRGISASNKSCARILTTRYCKKGFKQVLKPIKKAESFFENAVNSLGTIRHSTPPFVNMKSESLAYDPISKAYIN